MPGSTVTLPVKNRIYFYLDILPQPMMKKLFLFLFLPLIISCAKNEPPTCSIVSPSNNEVFTLGDTILISAEAADPDGLVSEVRLQVNQIGVSSRESFPYNFELPSGDYGVGTHQIKVTALDELGLEGSDEISVMVEADLPVVTTAPVADITDSTALAGGNVVSDGGAEITARGVCWSTSANPTIADNITSEGTGTGTFSSQIQGLECGITYYVRAYATNSQGTSYGDMVSFNTPDCISLPSVTTIPLTDITDVTARGGGQVESDGGAEVTARGICWSQDPDPTLEDSHTTDGSGSGSFVSQLSGLNCETLYYVRAYATNSVGTAYGEVHSFTTDYCRTVTDYDGNSYQTIQIGEQIWMAQNLKVTHYADGSAIPLVEAKSTWASMDKADKGYCWYDNNISIGNNYGALYNWAAAMNGAASSVSNPSPIQGVCPTGWHLPSHEEWKQLEIYLGMSQTEADNTGWRGTDEGGKMKDTGTDYWNSPNTGATNSSGFTAMPVGYRLIEGDYLNLGIYAIYWSCTEGNDTHAWYRHLINDKAKSGTNFYDKRAGLAVRCVRD